MVRRRAGARTARRRWRQSHNWTRETGWQRGRGKRFHATLTTLAPSSFPMPMEYGSASLPRQLGSGMMGGRG